MRVTSGLHPQVNVGSAIHEFSSPTEAPRTDCEASVDVWHWRPSNARGLLRISGDMQRIQGIQDFVLVLFLGDIGCIGQQTCWNVHFAVHRLVSMSIHSFAVGLGRRPSKCLQARRIWPMTFSGNIHYSHYSNYKSLYPCLNMHVCIWYNVCMCMYIYIQLYTHIHNLNTYLQLYTFLCMCCIHFSSLDGSSPAPRLRCGSTTWPWSAGWTLEAGPPRAQGRWCWG